MPSSPRPAVLATLAPLALLLGACSSSPNDQAALDSGAPDAAGPDATASDAAPDGDAATAPDVAPLLPHASLVGWTADARLVYQTSSGTFTRALDGGTDTIAKAPADGGAQVATLGVKGVFVRQGPDLGFWTYGAGYHALSFTAYGVTLQESADNAKVLYFEYPPTGGDPMLVVQNTDSTKPLTVPDALFGGAVFTATDGVIVAGGVSPATGGADGGFDGGDGGGIDGGDDAGADGAVDGGGAIDGGAVPGFTLYAGGSLSRLGQWAGTWVTDSNAATIAVVGGAAGGAFVRTSDGTATPFDTAASSGGVFDPAGASFYYVAGSALKRATVAPSPSASTLVASGATSAIAVSPDGSQLLYTAGSDYDVLATAAGAAPTKVATNTTSNAPFGFFTLDSKYVLTATAYDSTSQASTITASPVAGGAATATWTSIVYAVPLYGSRVVLMDASGGLLLVDASGAAAQASLASGVLGFEVSPDGAEVAYESGGASPGVSLAPAR